MARSLRTSLAALRKARPRFCTQAQAIFNQPQDDYPILPDFEDPHKVFASKTADELIKSCLILSSCRVKPVVQNARSCLDAASALLGSRLTGKIIERTYYKHFCLGYNDVSMAPSLALLRQRGLTPILNYAAEDDVKGSQDKDIEAAEANKDVHAARFVDAVNSSSCLTGQSFAAVKVTCLGDPDMLRNMSATLTEIGDNLDRGHSSSSLDKLMAASLTPAHFRAYKLMLARLHRIAEAADRKGKTRVLIDAESTYLQPAIDALVILLQQKYNKEEVVIMNTYQCYLKDSQSRIENDLKRSIDEKWHWSAKLVRGAYLQTELKLAEAENHPRPIHDTLQETHMNYDKCVQHTMNHVARGGPELMVATHNQQSVVNALHEMQKLGIKQRDPGSGIYFAQLLGMADNLSYPLGSHGYNAYKMCAFGEVNLCIDFLIRRALENSDALGGCKKEVELARTALYGRLWNKLDWFGKPVATTSAHA